MVDRVHESAAGQPALVGPDLGDDGREPLEIGGEVGGDHAFDHGLDPLHEFRPSRPGPDPEEGVDPEAGLTGDARRLDDGNRVEARAGAPAFAFPRREQNGPRKVLVADANGRDVLKIGSIHAGGIEPLDGRVDHEAIGAFPVVALAAELGERCEGRPRHPVEQVKRALPWRAAPRDDVPDDLCHQLGGIQHGRACGDRRLRVHWSISAKGLKTKAQSSDSRLRSPRAARRSSR